MGRTACFAATLALLATLVACRPPAETRRAVGSSTTAAVEVGAPIDGGRLVVGVEAESPGWSPAYAPLTLSGNLILSSVVEPLAHFDRGGNVVLWLAESVVPRTDGQFGEWLVRVRQGIRFHNGEVLDARVVKANLDASNSPGSLVRSGIGDFLREVTIVDDRTVAVVLNVPLASYPGTLTQQIGYMVATEQLAAPDHGMEHPIGTGPFVFDEWTPGRSLRVHRNDAYWRRSASGGALPHLEAIEFRPLPDASMRNQALLAGDIDLLVTSSGRDVVALDDRFTILEDHELEKQVVTLNASLEPFDNIHARRALAYATDRARLVELVGAGRPLALSSTPYVKGTKWEVDEALTGYVSFDPRRAREEIEAYTRATGRASLSFRLTGLADPDSQAVQQVLQAQWSEVGIDVTLHSLEAVAYTKSLLEGGLQAGLVRNYAYVDGTFDIFFYSSLTLRPAGEVSINFHRVADPDLDNAMATAALVTDDEQRKGAALKATRRINELALDVWLFNTPFAMVASRRVHGLGVAADQHFGTAEPKPWLWSALWLEPS